MSVQLTIVSTFAYGLIPFAGSVRADDGETIAAIKKLGGTVERVSRNTNEFEVAFHLSRRKLNDNGLKQVAGLRNIVSLNLRGTKITSVGLVHLKGLKKLRWLHLELTAIDDKGLTHLAGLTQLEYLNLFGTKVSDAGLKHLTGLKKLKRLFVWQTKVTGIGVGTLKKAIPSIRISRGIDLAKLPEYSEKPENLPKPKVDLKLVAVTDAKECPRSGQGVNTEVIFENKSASPVKLYWVGFNGKLKLYAELAPGSVRRQNSYSKHTWLITDQQENPIGYFVTALDVSRAVIPKD